MKPEMLLIDISISDGGGEPNPNPKSARPPWCEASKICGGWWAASSWQNSGQTALDTIPPKIFPDFPPKRSYRTDRTDQLVDNRQHRAVFFSSST